MKMFGKQFPLCRLFKTVVVASISLGRKLFQFSLHAIVCCAIVAAFFTLVQRFVPQVRGIPLYIVLAVTLGAIACWHVAKLTVRILRWAYNKGRAGTAKKQLFLRTVLCYIVVVMAFFFGQGIVGGIHGAPLWIIIAILLLTACLMVYSLKLIWKSEEAEDKLLEQASLELSLILHDTKHLGHFVWVCQIVAAVAIMIGVAFALRMPVTSTLDSVQTVFHAVSDGMFGTITGILCSLILENLRHFIKHNIEAWFIFHDREL